MSNQTSKSSGLDEEWARNVWAAGDYSRTAKHYLPMAARLVDSVGIDPDDDILDIGTGTGNLAITAAREGATVNGVDICTKLLETAQRRVESLGYGTITFDEGDAASLPYADDTFDVTVSNLGHMYADPPTAAAEELIRVTRPGGRIGFTAWTPMSLYPRMAGVALQHVPPSALPAYTEPPFMWGDEGTVRNRINAKVGELATETLEIGYPTVDPEAFWAEMTETSGMFEKLITSLDDDELQKLESDMITTIDLTFDAAENIVPLSYLQTIATLPKA